MSKCFVAKGPLPTPPSEFKADPSQYPAGEGLAALGAHEGGGHEVGVVVAAEVHVQQLLLAEGLLAVAAGIRLLPCVGASVHHHVALLGKRDTRKPFLLPPRDLSYKPCGCTFSSPSLHAEGRGFESV